MMGHVQLVQSLYDANRFNDLPLIERADAIMRKTDLLNRAFDKLGAVFLAHRMERHWGIGLLHNHWDINDGEFPLQQVFSTPEGREYITLPKQVDRIGRECWPSILAVSYSSKELLTPLEYSNDHQVRGAYVELLENREFIEEFANKAIGHELDKTFGLVALRVLDASDRELVEFNYDERISIVREVTRGKFFGSSIIETAWSFCASELVCTPSCFSKCVVPAKGGSHYHEHPKVHGR
jgi:hypothetical protein